MEIFLMRVTEISNQEQPQLMVTIWNECEEGA
jgi:hypothetical protein